MRVADAIGAAAAGAAGATDAAADADGVVVTEGTVVVGVVVVGVVTPAVDVRRQVWSPSWCSRSLQLCRRAWNEARGVVGTVATAFAAANAPPAGGVGVDASLVVVLPAEYKPVS